MGVSVASYAWRDPGRLLTERALTVATMRDIRLTVSARQKAQAISYRTTATVVFLLAGNQTRHVVARCRRQVDQVTNWASCSHCAFFSHAGMGPAPGFCYLPHFILLQDDRRTGIAWHWSCSIEPRRTSCSGFFIKHLRIKSAGPKPDLAAEAIPQAGTTYHTTWEATSSPASSSNFLYALRMILTRPWRSGHKPNSGDLPDVPASGLHSSPAASQVSCDVHRVLPQIVPGSARDGSLLQVVDTMDS